MRIASLSPATTEILFALGRASNIVCVDQFSNFPDGAKAIPHLHGHEKIDPEELRAFAPDIVLTETVVQAKLADVLRSAGFAVTHHDPRTLRDIEEGIRALGALFDAAREAEALVLRMRQGLNAVEKKARLLPKRPRVYVEEWHDPPFVSGNWVPEIVRAAGGEPFPLAHGSLSCLVTLEEVLAFDPSLLVISWCGAGTLAPAKLLLDRPGWDQLQAVQENRVRVIDDSFLNRPGPRLVEGANRIYGWLFEMLH
jgi:iron complex transport system substrate-binding protein